MKKFACFALALTMGLTSLTAFAAEEVEVNGYSFEIDTSKASEDIEIAVVYMNVSDIFASYLDEGIQAFAAESGANCYITGGTDWTAENTV